MSLQFRYKTVAVNYRLLLKREKCSCCVCLSASKTWNLSRVTLRLVMKSLHICRWQLPILDINRAEKCLGSEDDQCKVFCLSDRKIGQDSFWYRNCPNTNRSLETLK